MRRSFAQRPLPLKRTLVSLLLIFTFLGQLACDRQPAINLSKVGVETSTTLVEFYETLARNTNDTREMEIMWQALVKTVLTSDDVNPDPCNPRQPVPANMRARGQSPVNPPNGNWRDGSSNSVAMNSKVKGPPVVNPPARSNPRPSAAHAVSTKINSKTPGAYLTPANPKPRSQSGNVAARVNSTTQGAYAASANTKATERSDGNAAPAKRRLQGPTFGPDHQEKMNKRVSALRSRALMARQLANFLSALKTYSESDPGADVEEAANKLGNAVSSLIPLPLAPAAVPLLAGFAGDLKRWQQYKHIKDQMRVVQTGLSKIREFYDKEAQAYTSIAQENSNIATSVLQELIKLELVSSWTVFERLPKPFGMKWVEEIEKPEKRDEFKCAFIEVIRVRNERFMVAAKNATESLQDVLAEFDSNITDFLNKKTISWDNAFAALGRAKFYVEEIKKIRDAKEGD